MKYLNPIIKGFNPDPSICRVENDYYLVTSSFEYFPGIPIYHSTDLVNWEHIGNGIERQGQFSFSSVKSSEGIWAPTIRYNNGKFYITATFSGKGNFIITSDNPKNGWSEPVWIAFSGIDPSILFDNGKMYYCANDVGERNHIYGYEGISVAEMNPNTFEIIGEIKRVWCGASGGWLEAPHIYHIGEYYYIIAAEGGTGNGHHEIAARSKSIWGPYENCPENPILTNRNDCSKQITCSGHGDLIDDKNGQWWMVHLGVRPCDNMNVLGRETFLMPVVWYDEWFKVSEDKKSHIEVDAPIICSQKNISEWSADFNKKEFDKAWLWRRTPDMKNYYQTDGTLTIKPSLTRLCDNLNSPSFMAVRPIDIRYTAEAEFEFDTKYNGDSAGVVVYLSEDFYYRLYKKRENNKDYIFFEKKIGDINVIEYKKEIERGILKMSIESDGEKYYFRYCVNGKYAEAGSGMMKFLSTGLAGKCFTGTLVGIFAECDTETEATMNITRFIMTK